MSNFNEAQTIAQLTQQGTVPEALLPGTVYAVADGEGKLKVLDTDHYAEHPRHAKADRVVNDAESFNAYLYAHGRDTSEVWADTKNSTFIGVLDAHPGTGAGWEQHRVQLTLEKSKPWLAWEGFDGKLVPQLEFAEFIDARAVDVMQPTPADLIELAQFFQVNRKVEFESSQKIKDGETSLVFKETLAGKAGQKGNVEIPDSIQLVLRPYIGGPAYYVTARFRYRLVGDGNLLLGVLLERPQEILDAAFADIVTLIRDGKPETTDQPATADHPSVIASKGFAGISQTTYYGRPAPR